MQEEFLLFVESKGSKDIEEINKKIQSIASKVPNTDEASSGLKKAIKLKDNSSLKSLIVLATPSSKYKDIVSSKVS